MLKAAAVVQDLVIRLLHSGKCLVRRSQAVLRAHQASMKYLHDHSKHPHPERESQ